jgi:hypothetical protein
VRAIPLTLAVMLLGAAAAAAQDPVIKPSTTTTTTLDRLPGPAKITAVQQADGRIRVAWNAVDGAARYALYRSVPNLGQGYVALPNPSDTAFLDADVKAGFYYYYVVNAVSSTGGVGLKVGSQPVVSTTTVAGGTTGTTSTTGTASTTTASGIAAPSEVKAAITYPHGQVYFRTTQTGVRFAVERGIVTSTGTAFTSLGTFSCCFAYDMNLVTTVAGGTRVVYRVTAVDSITPTKRSTPVLSNEIATYRLEFRVETGGGMVQSAGATTPLFNLFTDGEPAKWTNRRIASFDPSIAEVTSDGGVFLRAPGVAYVAVMGTRPDGVTQTLLYRLQVAPRP